MSELLPLTTLRRGLSGLPRFLPRFLGTRRVVQNRGFIYLRLPGRKRLYLRLQSNDFPFRRYHYVTRLFLNTTRPQRALRLARRRTVRGIVRPLNNLILVIRQSRQYRLFRRRSLIHFNRTSGNFQLLVIFRNLSIRPRKCRFQIRHSCFNATNLHWSLTPILMFFTPVNSVLRHNNSPRLLTRGTLKRALNIHALMTIKFLARGFGITTMIGGRGAPFTHVFTISNVRTNGK